MKQGVKLFFIALLFVVVQVGVMGKISFVGKTYSMLYIYFLLFLPRQMNRNLLITIGFFYGLLIDLFYNTGGVHAFVTTFIAYARQPLTLLNYSKPEEDEGYTFRKAKGTEWFGMVASFFTIHHLLFFVIEFYSFESWQEILLRFLLSTLLDIFVVFIVENIQIRTNVQIRR